MIIIDGKDKNKKRVSVSIDEQLWDLFAIELNDQKQARRHLREAMKKEEFVSAKWARGIILMHIIKPALKRKYKALENNESESAGD